MKRKILFVLILAVLFSACKMKLSENPVSNSVI